MTRSMQVRRWEPFRDVLGFQREMDRLLDRTFGGEQGMRGTWSPELEIRETDDAFTIFMDVPGMSSKDVEVTLDRNLLTVRGSRAFVDEREGETVHRVERRYGAFERTITLPSHVDADGIGASVTDGVLEVTVPKAAEARPRQIKVGEGARQIEA